MNSRPAHRAFLVCAIYFGLHMAVVLLTRSFPHDSGMGLRQTPGLAVGLLVLYGPGFAPVVFASQIVSTFIIHQSLPLTWTRIFLPLVSTSAYAAAAWLVRRRLGPAPLPVNRRQATALGLAALAVPLPVALVGAALMRAGGANPGSFLNTVLVHWIGGTASILTIVPAVAVYVAGWALPGVGPRLPRPLSGPGKIEIAAETAAVLLSLWLVYYWASMHGHPAFFLCVVPLIWIGLRHGLAGTTLAALAINIGGYLILRLTRAPAGVVVDYLPFQTIFAVIGLGLGTAVDLRNRAEAALAESQARLKRVLFGAKLGMWDCDLAAGQVAFDETWAEIVGWPLGEIPKQLGWWESRLHPDDRPHVERLLEEHLAGRTPFYETEYRFKVRDGSWKWIHARGSVTARDAAGKPLRHAGTQLDLTDRKQAEADKNRLLQIIEASPDFIGSADPENRVIYANPALLRLRGIPDLATARCLKCTDFYPAWVSRMVTEEGRSFALEHGSWTGETALLDAGGREIPVSQLLIVHRDDRGQPAYFSTIARDISKQKETEATRLETERAMLQAQKLESLGVLAGGIAHDFNNLLTVVLGNVSLAQFDIPEGSPPGACLEQIRAATMRATELCRQMLAYSGKGQFSSVLIDLSTLVEDTTHLLQVSISKKCVLKFELQLGLPPVRVDPTQIRQIVMNLVTNASDAIGEHSGHIRIATGLVRADSAYLSDAYLAPRLEPGDYSYLEVSDDGCGMTPEVKARIFDPFFTTKFAGRGLGLAAVLGIVRGHRGALKVASEPGRGSTFKLLLPAETGAAADATPPAASIPGAAERGEGAILIVDDEDTVRTVAARLLESNGYATVLASDGREAVRIFSERPREFRAVLLDLTMPHMNGEETFRELRRVRSDVPVLLMSGYSEKESTDRFADRDIAAFIPKPFDRETLITRLRGVLEAKPGERGGAQA